MRKENILRSPYFLGLKFLDTIEKLSASNRFSSATAYGDFDIDYGLTRVHFLYYYQHSDVQRSQVFDTAGEFAEWASKILHEGNEILFRKF